ncbi:MAG: hypothetical protein LBR88_07725 [Zoogloeaceae bacterium]|nr:hypothetical protein [Zoogloeaceae bacterium]
MPPVGFFADEAPDFQEDGFLHRREAGGHVVRTMGTILDILALLFLVQK